MVTVARWCGARTAPRRLVLLPRLVTEVDSTNNATFYFNLFKHNTYFCSDLIHYSQGVKCFHFNIAVFKYASKLSAVLAVLYKWKGNITILSAKSSNMIALHTVFFVKGPFTRCVCVIRELFRCDITATVTFFIASKKKLTVTHHVKKVLKTLTFMYIDLSTNSKKYGIY